MYSRRPDMSTPMMRAYTSHWAHQGRQCHSVCCSACKESFRTHEADWMGLCSDSHLRKWNLRHDETGFVPGNEEERLSRALRPHRVLIFLLDNQVDLQDNVRPKNIVQSSDRATRRRDLRGGRQAAYHSSGREVATPIRKSALEPRPTVQQP